MTIDEFVEEWCGLREKGWRRTSDDRIRVSSSSFYNRCPIVAVAIQRGWGPLSNYHVEEAGRFLGLVEKDVSLLAAVADRWKYHDGKLAARLEECWKEGGNV